MRYNKRKKQAGVPVWVWCLGALTAYFMFFFKDKDQGIVVNEMTGRYFDEPDFEGNIFETMKSRQPNL